MKKLKVDFHLHTREDPKEWISHSAIEAIDLYSKLNYDAISITNHNAVTYNDFLKQYASKKGILLIPGIEITVQGKHVLVINEDISPESLSTFHEIRKIKSDRNLIIAPHPYYPYPNALNSLLHKHLDIFDALEFCHHYNYMFGFNDKALNLADECNLPLVGTSDAHMLSQIETTYSLVEAEEKTPDKIISAIKNGKIEYVSRPLSMAEILKINITIWFKCNLPRWLSNRLRRVQQENYGDYPD